MAALATASDALSGLPALAIVLGGARWTHPGPLQEPRGRARGVIDSPTRMETQPTLEAEENPAPELDSNGVDVDVDDVVTDATLVERFKAGDETAFNVIVQRYSTKVLKLSVYFLKDHNEAHDVSQEVFVKIHRSLAKFRGDSKLSTWIHTIAANCCKNKLSFWKRVTTRRKRYEEAKKVFYEPWTPHDEAEQSERVRIIRENILSLPEKYRMVVILKDLKGLSYEEIAAALDIQEGTVKSRLHRAREKLARKLAPIFRNG